MYRVLYSKYRDATQTGWVKLSEHNFRAPRTVRNDGFDDDDVYYYIGERIRLERETGNMCV